MALMEEANEFDPTQDLEAFQAEREEETRANRSEVLDQFRTARRKAVGHLHLVATQVAATQEDDVAGTKLAAEFYEHVANGLSRSDVAGMFSNQTGANQAQVVELEAVRGQLNTAEQELEQSNQTNEQLRRSALEASDLRNQLAAKEEELRLANEEVNRLKREADKPNPLKSENDRLTRENSRLTTQVQTLQTELNDETEAHRATRHELEQLQQQRPEIIDPALEPPVAQPEPPAAASSDEPPQPLSHKEEMERRRGIRGVLDKGRGVLPGHSNPTNTPKDGEK